MLNLAVLPGPICRINCQPNGSSCNLNSLNYQTTCRHFYSLQRTRASAFRSSIRKNLEVLIDRSCLVTAAIRRSRDAALSARYLPRIAFRLKIQFP
jgi:hypothetical protein